MADQLRAGVPPDLAYFRIGKAYFGHDEWARAAANLEKSIQAREANDQAHLLLGLACRELKQPARAEQEFARAATLNPQSSVDAYFAGHQLLLDANYDAALPYLYAAVKLDPQNASAYRALGMAQVHLGNYGLAESYYRKAIESAQAPEDRYASRVNLSILLLLGHDSARIEEGLSYAQQAGKLEPNSAAAHFLVGKALYKLGRLEEARSELERAATLNPGDSKPHFLLGRVYDQLGQHDRAENEMQIVSRIQARPGQTGMATMDPSPITPE